MAKKKEKIYKNIRLPSKLKSLTLEFVEKIIDTFETEKKLNQLDSLSLYLLAENLDQYFQCSEEIKKSGLTVITDRGNSSLSPYVQLQKSLMKDIMGILKEFGLTLNSRSKLKVLNNAIENDSPLMQLLKDEP